MWILRCIFISLFLIALFILLEQASTFVNSQRRHGSKKGHSELAEIFRQSGQDSACTYRQFAHPFIQEHDIDQQGLLPDRYFLFHTVMAVQLPAQQAGQQRMPPGADFPWLVFRRFVAWLGLRCVHERALKALCGFANPCLQFYGAVIRRQLLEQEETSSTPIRTNPAVFMAQEEGHLAGRP